jgi:hypothetical protein
MRPHIQTKRVSKARIGRRDFIKSAAVFAQKGVGRICSRAVWC